MTTDFWKNLADGAGQALQNYEPETEAQRNARAQNQFNNASRLAEAAQNNKYRYDALDELKRHHDILEQQYNEREKRIHQYQDDLMNLNRAKLANSGNGANNLKNQRQEEYINLYNAIQNAPDDVSKKAIMNEYTKKFHSSDDININQGDKQTKRKISSQDVFKIYNDFRHSKEGQELIANGNKITSNKGKNLSLFNTTVGEYLPDSMGKPIDISNAGNLLDNAGRVIETKAFQKFLKNNYGIDLKNNEELKNLLMKHSKLPTSLAPEMTRLLGENATNQTIKLGKDSTSEGLLTNSLDDAFLKIMSSSSPRENPYEQQNQPNEANDNEIQNQLLDINQNQNIPETDESDNNLPEGDSGEEGGTPTSEQNQEAQNIINQSEIPDNQQQASAPKQEDKIIEGLTPLSDEEKQALNQEQSMGITLLDVATRPIRDIAGDIIKIGGKVAHSLFSPMYSMIGKIADNIMNAEVKDENGETMKIPLINQEIQDKVHQYIETPEGTQKLGDFVEGFGRTKGGDEFIENHPIASFALSAIPFFTPAGEIMKPLEFAGDAVATGMNKLGFKATSGLEKIVNGAFKANMANASLGIANTVANTKWDGNIFGHLKESLEDSFSLNNVLINSLIGGIGGKVSSKFEEKKANVGSKFEEAKAKDDVANMNFKKMDDDEIVKYAKENMQRLEGETEDTYNAINKNPKSITEEDKDVIRRNINRVVKEKGIIKDKTDKELLQDYLEGSSKPDPMKRLLNQFENRVDNAEDTADLMKIVQDINDDYGSDNYHLLSKHLKDPIGMMIDEKHDGRYTKANDSYENFLNARKVYGINKVKYDRTEGKKPQLSEFIDKSALETIKKNFDNQENQQILRSGAIFPKERVADYVAHRFHEKLSEAKTLEDQGKIIDELSNSFDPTIKENPILQQKINGAKQLVEIGQRSVGNANKTTTALNDLPSIITSRVSDSKQIFDNMMSNKAVKDIFSKNKDLSELSKIFDDLEKSTHNQTHLFDTKQAKLASQINKTIQSNVDMLRSINEFAPEGSGLSGDQLKVIDNQKSEIKNILESLVSKFTPEKREKMFNEALNEVIDKKHSGDKDGITAKIIKSLTKDIYEYIDERYTKPALKSDFLKKELGEENYKKYIDTINWRYKFQASALNSINLLNYLRAMVGMQMLKQDLSDYNSDKEEILQLGEPIDE